MVRHHSQWRVLDVSAAPGSAAESRAHVRAGSRAAETPVIAGPWPGLAGTQTSPEAD